MRTTPSGADVEAASPAELEILGPATDRGSGTVLHGRQGGRRVLVRRVPAGPDARSRSHAALLARRLLEVDHPGLLPVRAVLSDWRWLDLVYEDLVYDDQQGETSLAALGRTRRLAAGEVVSVGLAVAESLLCLHDVGLCHGRLSAADVLLRPDGEVLLTGYGVAAVLGSAGSVEDDVRDLVALLLLSLDDTAGALRRSLEPLARSDQGRADVLISVLHQSSFPPMPVRIAEPAGRIGGLPVPRPPRRSSSVERLKQSLRRLLPAPRLGWRFLGGVLPAALGVLLLAGWLGASLQTPAPDEPVTAQPAPGPGRSSPAPAAPPAPTAPPVPPAPTAPPAPAAPTAPPAVRHPAPTDWRSVLAELNTARGLVLGAADERRLATVDAPGSSAYAADLALVRALAARDAVGRNVRTDVVSVTARSVGTERADLTVVDVLRPYTIEAVRGPRRGTVLQRRLGRSARTTTVVLVRVSGAWRVAEVQPG